MTKTVIISLLLLLTITGIPLAAENMRLMRTPDASATQICFIYQDDLFTAGLDGSHPVRLVGAVGQEALPRFSPDGRWIAFSSSFNGNYNIYVVPAQGGTVRQLTYEPEGASMLEWSPDGQYIYFLSHAASFSPFFRRIFRVSFKGGLPALLPLDQAATLSFNERGDAYVCNRHGLHFWWWKRYRGTANTDIWMYAQGRFTNLTKTPTNESWPIWVGESVYFVAEDQGQANLYRLDLKSGQRVALTHHTDDDIQWPALSSQRDFIVYEYNAGIWRYDLASGQESEIVVPATVQNSVPEYEFVSPLKLIRAYDLSPTGKRLVCAARGEIFTAPAKYGEIRQLTHHCDARDEEPVWSPRGDQIAFISDRDGEANIYLVDQFAHQPVRQLTKRHAKFLRDLRWSPDGRYLSYVSSDYALWIYDTQTQQERLVQRFQGYRRIEYNWSPDSDWLVYVRYGSNLLPQIWVYHITKKKHHLVFSSVGENHLPAFSADGQHLFFVTERVGAPACIAMLSLQPETQDPLEHAWDEESGPPPTAKSASKHGSQAKKGPAPKQAAPPKGQGAAKRKVRIDFQGLARRIHLLGLRAYHYNALVPAKDGLYLGFRPMVQKISTGKNASRSRGYDLYYYQLKNQKLTLIAQNIRGFVLSHNGKKLLLRKGNQFQIVAAGRKAGNSGYIKLAGLSMRLDRRQEWHQIFGESWRLVRDCFYDPQLHGVDWSKMKRKYARLIDYCQTRQDVNRVLLQLVGELNASHQGVHGGDMPPPKTVAIGALGAQLSPDPAGYYRFSKIYHGNPLNAKYNAPLDKPFLKVKEGDYLLAINGTPVSTKVDYHQYLLNTVGRTITLTINHRPQKAGAWDIRVKPIRSEYQLRYLDWIESNRRLVTTKSKGRIGYLHLNFMLSEQLNKFYNYIQAYFDKEGLILDVRFNGGGGIDPQLIDYLERRQYQVFRLRDGLSLPRPSSLFRGHVVVLCNEHSYSDAEVFPNAFRVRGLGKVIGIPTLGFVIAVSGHRLIDNGIIRKTFVGVWDIHGNQLESRGAIPDIIVANDPNDLARGIDAQLNKAIEYLMQTIRQQPVFPKIDTHIRPR